MVNRWAPTCRRPQLLEATEPEPRSIGGCRSQERSGREFQPLLSPATATLTRSSDIGAVATAPGPGEPAPPCARRTARRRWPGGAGRHSVRRACSARARRSVSGGIVAQSGHFALRPGHALGQARVARGEALRVGAPGRAAWAQPSARPSPTRAARAPSRCRRPLPRAACGRACAARTRCSSIASRCPALPRSWPSVARDSSPASRSASCGPTRCSRTSRRMLS